MSFGNSLVNLCCTFVLFEIKKVMKNILFYFLFFTVVSYGQISSVGRINVNVNEKIKRSDEFCSTTVEQKFYIVIKNSELGEKLLVQDVLTGREIGCKENSQGLIDWSVEMDGYKFYIQDDRLVNDTAYLATTETRFICGSDTFNLAAEERKVGIEKPCIYDNFKGTVVIKSSIDSVEISSGFIDFTKFRLKTELKIKVGRVGYIVRDYCKIKENGLFEFIYQKTWSDSITFSLMDIENNKIIGIKTISIMDLKQFQELFFYMDNFSAVDFMNLKVKTNLPEEKVCFELDHNSELYPLNLEIYDTRGLIVQKLDNIREREFCISDKNLSFGIYYYKLFSSKRLLKEGEFLINN